MEITLMSRRDFELHRHLADKQDAPRPPPPQVMALGHPHYHDVRIVFAANGQKVPWDVISVDCPGMYLMRHHQDRSRGLVRESGHFRVEWDDE